MRTGSIILAAGLVILGACSTQPTARSPTATPVAHAAATAAPVADARYVAFVRSARAQGYRPVTAGGKANWCREATSIDSRVTRQSCIRPPAVADAQGPGDEGSEPARTGE